MGDCCSTCPNKPIDDSALPETRPIIPVNDTTDDIYPNGETKKSTPEMKKMKPKKKELPIEDQWKKAVQDSNNKEIKKIFQQNHKKMNFESIIFENGDTSLHFAARTGNAKLLEFLLKVKFDIDAVNQHSGNTALHYAVLFQNDKIVEILMTYGCNPDIPNKYHKLPKDIAKEKGNEIILRLLSHASINSLGTARQQSIRQMIRMKSDPFSNNNNNINSVPTPYVVSPSTSIGNNSVTTTTTTTIAATDSVYNSSVTNSQYNNNNNNNNNDSNKNDNNDNNSDNDSNVSSEDNFDEPNNNNNNNNSNNNYNLRSDSNHSSKRKLPRFGSSQSNKSLNKQSSINTLSPRMGSGNNSVSPRGGNNNNSKIPGLSNHSSFPRVNSASSDRNNNNLIGSSILDSGIPSISEAAGMINEKVDSDAFDDNNNGDGGGGSIFDKPRTESQESLSIVRSKTEQMRKQNTYMRLDILQDVKQHLPVLRGFLEKKRPKPPYTFQKRWVIVSKPYILWSDEKKFPKDVHDVKEREEFNSCIHMLHIEKVEGKKSKSEQNKFIITARSVKDQNSREFMFRCDSQKTRDDWVNGLQAYITYEKGLHEELTSQ